MLPFFSNTREAPACTGGAAALADVGGTVGAAASAVPRVGGAVDPPWVSTGRGAGEDSRVDGQAAHREPGGVW